MPNRKIRLGRKQAIVFLCGFSQNLRFSGDSGACIVVNDAIAVMLAKHTKFRDFTPKAICDTRGSGHMASQNGKVVQTAFS